MLTFGWNMLLLALGWTSERRRIGWLISLGVRWKEHGPLVSKEEKMEPGPDGDRKDSPCKGKLFFSIVGGKCKYERMRLLSGPQCCFCVSSPYILLSWRWRKNISPKCRYSHVRLNINHARTQKTICAVKNSKLGPCYEVSSHIFQFSQPPKPNAAMLRRNRTRPSPYLFIIMNILPGSTPNFGFYFHFPLY